MDLLTHILCFGAGAWTPPFATALVRANAPEWCVKGIGTMEDLRKAVGYERITEKDRQGY